MDLLDVMTPENLLPIISSDHAAVQTLAAYLPEEERVGGISAVRELLYHFANYLV